MNIKYRVNYRDNENRILSYGIYKKRSEAEQAIVLARSAGYSMPIEIVTINS
jgi:uncharacterized protein YegP (UPF0339 family)